MHHFVMICYSMEQILYSSLDIVALSRQEDDRIPLVLNLTAAALFLFQRWNVRACLDAKIHKETKASESQDYHPLSITVRPKNVNGKDSPTRQGHQCGTEKKATLRKKPDK